MISGESGAVLEAVAEGFDTGLVGTLAVSIDDNLNNDVLPRTTAGITEIETVGTKGVYSYVGVFPSMPGSYTIIWDDGTTTGTEQIIVTNAFAPSPDLSPTALCTDEDVRMYLGIKTDDLSDEDRSVIVRLVNAASETFTDESQRLWKNDPTLDGQPRLYRLDAFDVAVGRLRIDDCTTVNSIGIGGFRDPLGPQPLVDGWWPWQEEPGLPITAVVFADSSGLTDIGSGPPVSLGSTVAALRTSFVVQVDAYWGWPRVPEKVRQAVIYTAAEWYARDVEKFSATFSLDQGRILMPQVLPSQVQREAEGYRRWRVA